MFLVTLLTTQTDFIAVSYYLYICIDVTSYTCMYSADFRPVYLCLHSVKLKVPR